MEKEKITIEKRLQAVKDFYFKLDDVMNMLPDIVPEEVKNKIKSTILEDEELKKLMQGVEECRPPRFLLVGRSRCGKSSLINAMCGMYVADVSDVEVGTYDVERYECKENDRVLMEILDSRGIDEYLALENMPPAEEVLMEKITEFRPDAILCVTTCASLSGTDKVYEYVKELKHHYWKKTKVEIPVIIAMNRADEMAPSVDKDPKKYSHRKLENIEISIGEHRKILNAVGLSAAAIVPVTSYIRWGKGNHILEQNEIADLLPKEKEELEVVEDYRYNIPKLIDELAHNLDVDASMGLMVATDLNDAVARVANKFVKAFAAIAGAVALLPLPGFITLSALEAVMVVLIGYLSGEELDIKAAGKFIGSLFGIGLGGTIFKATAREIAKILGGPIVSAGVASTGVIIIGKAAIQYYVYGLPMKKIKKDDEIVALTENQVV